MNNNGSFGFGGQQRSYSFSCFHADIIPNSEIAAICPNFICEWVAFQNDPASTGNLTLGSDRIAAVGTGIELEPGKVTGWIPANNLNLVWHKEDDATTFLNYMLVGCAGQAEGLAILDAFLLQENGSYLIQEDGDKIIL
jgi:hypothetical protein